ncbi:hypothetical protein M5K25_006746 [Dendrobium thyrsiflorum]|uniref:Uncharacterized protein n=1 Tax=Dendrobium thyrsiflorum TaxID=117978 RepID=A0ABD0VDL8_DENTH
MGRTTNSDFCRRESDGEIMEEKGGRYGESHGYGVEEQRGAEWECREGSYGRRGADFEGRRGEFEGGFGYGRVREDRETWVGQSTWERGNYGGIRENDVEIMEEMLRKLMEMQFKTPLTGPIAKPNQDLTKIPLAESKGREIRRSSMREDQKVKILAEEEEISPLDQLPRRGKGKRVKFLGEL